MARTTGADAPTVAGPPGDTGASDATFSTPDHGGSLSPHYCDTYGICRSCVFGQSCSRCGGSRGGYGHRTEKQPAEGLCRMRIPTMRLTAIAVAMVPGSK